MKDLLHDTLGFAAAKMIRSEGYSFSLQYDVFIFLCDFFCTYIFFGYATPSKTHSRVEPFGITII